MFCAVWYVNHFFIVRSIFKLYYNVSPNSLICMSRCIRQHVQISTTSFKILSRLWSGVESQRSTNGEMKVKKILKQRFPTAKVIEVTDISGGCGAMFEIMVETQEFKGMKTVKQHRLINEALKEEIKDMHGLRIHTSVPS